MAPQPGPAMVAERRDLRARALRDMLADTLHCHPRKVGGLSAEVVAAMLEELSVPRRRDGAKRLPTSLVITPAWDSRAG